jgi:hypothetical protein
MSRQFATSARSAESMRRGIHLVKPSPVLAGELTAPSSRGNRGPYAKRDVRESRLLALAILAMTFPLTWFLHELLHMIHF